ncbi:hypothetical protein FRC08_004349 [Ceratobasidium sp. 394]|nr:hypothetical protein FRC08_004349 [Ceratobasidium sp. 394]
MAPASQPPAKSRHQIGDIKLEPTTSKHAVSLKVLVNGQEISRLPEIKAGQQLHWTSGVKCDTLPSSRVTIRVYERQLMKRSCVGSAGYVVSDIAGQSEAALESDTHRYTITATFPKPEPDVQSATEALSEAEATERHKRVLDKLGSTRVAIKAILELGRGVADLLPVTEVAFSSCTEAWHKLEAQRTCDAHVELLMTGLSGILPFVKLVEKAARLPHLQSTVTALLHLIEDASRFIIGYNMDGRAVQTIRLFADSGAQEQVNGLLKKLEELKEEFDRSINVQMLLDAQCAVLKELKPLGEARYNSTCSCLPGTREQLLGEVVGWCMNSSTSESLLWIYGQAGLGKSAIATSLCERLDKNDALAVSFFCKRDNVQRRDPQRVLTSVIHGITLRHDSYAKAVATAIQQDSSLCSSPMHMQYEKLVKELLPSQGMLDPDIRHVVVVDALDECGTQETRQQLLGYLRGMSQLVSWLKIVVTSRPDQDMRDYFDGLPKHVFASRDVYQYDASNDIYVFVQQRFIESNRRAKSLPDDAVTLLAEAACGLFIWAQTACKLVLNDYDPRARFEAILGSTKLEDTLSPLDALYTTAIECSLGDNSDSNTKALRQCLGAIIVCSTRTPLSVDALSELLGRRVRVDVLQSVVESLGSVLYTDHNQGGAVRVYHPSFADYMTIPARSKQFYVDVEERNMELAESCLEAMVVELKFNICGLESSYVYNKDVPDLAQRVDSTISGRLRYSCVYWTTHLVDSGGAGTLVNMALLDKVVTGPTVLYWIEALALMGRLGTALSSIRELMTCCQSKILYAYAADLERFIQTFYDAISQSTPHLYLSALAFLPANARIAELQRAYFPNTIRITSGGEQTWSAWLRCMSHESAVQAVAISPDGRRTVAGMFDGTLRLWDTHTGAPIGKPFVGHSECVSAVTFSPDGRHILSGSEDETLRVWDAETSTPIGDPLVGHSGPVESVAYSPDGRFLASGSLDHTIRVWWADTHTLLGAPFADHSRAVLSVAFSPDSLHIVSGSWDKTLRVWDVMTGTMINGPLTGHSDWVLCVGYSADGRRIVSGSSDGTLRVWDADTGAPVGQPIVGHSDWVCSVAVHPDRNRVASGSADKTIRVWDLDTGALAGTPLTGHSDCVYSVAFTPDGRRLVSGSKDKTVRVWDASVGPSAKNASTGHSALVVSVSFSPDSRRLVSGSDDMTVRIWDVETGTPIGEPLVGHSGKVGSVAVSPDSCIIASGSADKTVRLWDATSISPTLRPLTGHLDEVTCVAFSPDSRRLASGSSDRTVRVWDTATGALVGGPFWGHARPVTCVAFSPDGHHILSGSRDGTVRAWDTETGMPVGNLLIGNLEWIHCISFLPGGHHIVSSSNDQMVRLWDLETGVQFGAPLTGHTNSVECVAVFPNGHLIASGSYDRTVRLWDADSGAPLGDPLVGHTRPVASISFSADCLRLASGSHDGTVRVWDAQAIPQTMLSLPTLEDPPQDPSLVRDGDNAPSPADASITQRSPSNMVSCLPRHINRLARYCQSDGWVCTESNELLFWLPPEYRRGRDDSALVIASDPLLHTVVLDYSSFVHGASWTGVRKVQN